MTKTMKFQPGTFLEMDDLAGGRKVVVVGRDGATYWDMLSADLVTPTVIHPSMNPLSLGSMVDFVGDGEAAQSKLESIATYLKDKGFDPENNPLFMMRVLWASTRATPADLGDEPLLEHAVSVAQEQEAVALKIHARAKSYCA